MSFNAWEECREHLGTYGNEELLADWDEAVERDRADPDGMARLILWDAVRSGEYWDARRRQKQAVPRPKTPIYPVGRAVAAERVRARFSQRTLGEAAGISRDCVARIERDVRHLTFQEACRLADALRVPLDRFRPIE